MRSLYLTPIILIFLFSSSSYGQDGSVSDLQEKLKTAQGEERIDILNRLSTRLISNNYDKGGEYAEEAYKASEKANYASGFITSAYYLAIYNRDKKRFGRASRYAEEGVKRSKSINNAQRELKGYEILRTIHLVANNPKRLAEAKKNYDQVKTKITANQLSNALDGLQKEYDTKAEELNRSESERQEIADELSLTVEEKLMKEKELAELAQRKAELELEAMELENQTTRDSLEIIEKEKEILEVSNQLRQKQFVITLSIIGLAASALIIFVLIQYYSLKRRSAEERIKNQRQLMMQEKMATLGQLTAGIAHEIKNPLNFVNNFAEGSSELADELIETVEDNKPALKEDQFDLMVEIAGDLKQNAQDISQNGKRADRIIQSMMDHARGDSGQKQLVDINHLLQENLNLSYQGFRGFSPDFQATLEEDLPESFPRLEVIPQDFSRVLLNIFNNAFYALNEKKVELGEDFQPTLKISTKVKNNEGVIKIWDNGPGIPEEVRSKIFNPFYTTKPTGQGNTGLGLSISYDIIVQVHEGKLEVNTEAGEFTEFVIKMPLKS